MRGVQWGRAGCGRPIVRMLQFQPTAQVLKGYVYLNPTNLKISVTDLAYQLKKFLVMNYRNYSWKEFFSKDRRLSSNTEQQTLLILQLVVDNRSIATENVGWWLSVSLEIDHAVYVGACAQPGGQREAYRLFRFQGPQAASSSPYLWLTCRLLTLILIQIKLIVIQIKRHLNVRCLFQIKEICSCCRMLM